MTSIRNIPGNLRKVLQWKPSAKKNAADHLNEWKKMGDDLRSIERQMKATVENGVNLSGPEAMINREQYRALTERHRSLTSQFASMGQLVTALNSESMLAEERETVNRMAQQAARLGDPVDYETALDELMLRRSMLDERVSAVNEARSRYETASTAMQIPEDDEYARRVNEARARKEARLAAVVTELKLDAREQTADMEGEISE